MTRIRMLKGETKQRQEPNSKTISTHLEHLLHVLALDVGVEGLEELHDLIHVQSVVAVLVSKVEGVANTPGWWLRILGV